MEYSCYISNMELPVITILFVVITGKEKACLFCAPLRECPQWSLANHGGGACPARAGLPFPSTQVQFYPPCRN
jgi:hypothetical protein